MERIRRKPAVAPFITGRFRMLSAIDFDDQTRRVTQEVGNVGPDWHLSAELYFPEAAIAQREPEFAFRISHVGAQRASPRDASTGQALTRLAPAALGTLSRVGRGFWSARYAHRFNFQ